MKIRDKLSLKIRDKRASGLALTRAASMAYNTRMIFVETKLFTDRILDALSDD